MDVETRYPKLKKLALVLMVASKKLRHYFHAYSIKVLTNSRYAKCYKIQRLLK